MNTTELLAAVRAWCAESYPGSRFKFITIHLRKVKIPIRLVNGPKAAPAAFLSRQCKRTHSPPSRRRPQTNGGQSPLPSCPVPDGAVGVVRTAALSHKPAPQQGDVRAPALFSVDSGEKG